jgi:hypothetical protein
MANDQQNDSTKATPGGPVAPAPTATKPSEVARKGPRTPHAAGSGSSTGDPGNPRGQGRVATPKD